MLQYCRLSKQQVADIYYDYMQQDFPPAELKPLEVLHQLMELGAYEPYGWFDEADTLVAYTFFVKAPNGKTVLLDYFAVLGQFRSHGYGSQCLAQMRQMHSGMAGILAEVEDPAKSASDEERTTRERRVAFYQRNGLRPTQLYSVLFGVPYVMHYFPVDEDCTDVVLLEELNAIYHVLFPAEVCAAQAKMWLTESEGDR